MTEALRGALMTFGPSCGNKSESRRAYSINILLPHVTALFPENQPTIELEATVKSASVMCSGFANMLVPRKRRKIPVVQAKREALLQGQAQDSMLMDITIARNEEDSNPSDVMLGIVSTFTEWMFYRRTGNTIEWADDSISETANLKEDVKRVVG